MSEFALIQRYFATLTPAAESVALGIGDDCALLQVPQGESLAVSIDTQVEGVHFPVGASAEQIGSRTACCALSDLAAMGAKPLWATLALTIPSMDDTWLAGFSRGLGKVLTQYQVALVGGDTTQGPLSITLQVHGAVSPQQALRRSGAQVGDYIYLTGNLGDGAAALAFIQGQLSLSDEAGQYLVERFYTPEPQISAGLALAGLASSAIDISDGLLADITHILNASATGASINLESLPISPLWRDALPAVQAQHFALNGGDDYQLCFTLNPNHAATLQQLLHGASWQAHLIGTITQEPGITALLAGVPVPITLGGYEHFH